MKMTDADERALAAVQEAMNYAPRDLRDKAWLGYGHIADRLAADQQKGGGEVAEYQSQVTDKATGKVVHPWSHCGRAAYDAAKGQPHEGSRLRVEYRKLYTTPQPSIPAPAQQEVDVDRLRALIANWQTPPTRAGESWITVQARQACAHQLAAALAHPPHADQETQG